MVLSAAVGDRMVPTAMMAARRGPRKISAMLPERFGPWTWNRQGPALLVNPETQRLLDSLYSELVERIYVHQDGYQIMLTIAYGEDQADNREQLHYPEVCYPAQGFAIRSNTRGTIDGSRGRIEVRRLESVLAGQRFEPITYWTIVGDSQVIDGWGRKRAEIRHGLKGEIVDGLLFRISSIDRDSAGAWQRQVAFVNDLADALDPEARMRLMAL
jgi:EpsI family protein